MSTLIGIDVGTTAVKAALFDARGTVLDAVTAPYPSVRGEDGHVEQDPSHWLARIDAALVCFAARADASEVAAIGITSQVNTHVFTDAKLQPLLPAIVWQDGRAHMQAIELDAGIEEGERIAWWGAPLPIDASHALSRMRWVQTHAPDTWQATRHVLLPKDWCIAQLTGKLLSDPLSNIGLVNLSGQLEPDLLARVEGAAQRLPALADMVSVAGRVRPGRPFAGTPVALGTMDAWAGVFGTGSTAEGCGVYLSGTSEILGILSHDVQPTAGVLVMPESHGLRLHVGPTQSGGAAQLWFCDLFGMTPEAMSAAAAQHRPSRHTPLFLPHLHGERAPLWDARARGVFLGLSNATDRSAMAWAVYEGVACSAALLLDALSASAMTYPTALNAGGGGFRSDVWNRIRADQLGVELRRVASTDPGTLGAAGLASVAIGQHASIDDVFATLVHVDRRYEPDAALADWRSERLALYRDAYGATRPLSHRLS